MIGILLIYFIGRAFYNLAEKFGKNKWLFAVLGVISYYRGTFIGGVILGILIELGILSSIDSFSDLLLGLLAIPIGLLTCWGLYAILKSQWNKAPQASNTELLDSEMQE